MKLSRTGWNNVIIFSIMAYILLINTTHNTLFGGSSNDSGQIALLPANSLILTVKVNNQVTIERIGQTWRSNPVKQVPSQSLSAMIMAWQQSYGTTLAQEPLVDVNAATVVSIALAGQEQPAIFLVINSDNQTLIKLPNDDQWLSIAPEIFQQLLPNNIVN